MTNETGLLSCMIVDDEPPAVETLKTYIAAVSGLKLETTCYNAIEASNYLRNKTIDLLFLDIQMPILLGTDLVRSLKNPPDVIFTTAYRNFAVDGFELDAVDFLLKPISFERFLKSVNKVMHSRLKSSAETMKHHSEPGTVTLTPTINLRVDRKNIKINLDDILYIESLKDYVKVITTTRTIITKQSMSSIEELLQGRNFLRIYRSYIASVDKITSFTANTIEIRGLEFPISRMYRLEANNVLGGR